MKTSKKIDTEKIEQVKLSLISELIDPTIELLQWMDTVGGLIPRNNIFKIPFFDTNNLLERNPWRICPLGESWGKRHFRPPLHPDYVKALMATESTFESNSLNNRNLKKIGPARGLLQMTVDTQLRLSGERKELKNYFVIIADNEIFDSNKNICGSIRWLFRKRETAKARLKRDPTWEEVLMEYKGKLKGHSKETKNIKEKLENYLKQMDQR